MGQKNSKNGSIAINEKTTKEERNTSRKSETVTAATEHGAKKEKNKGDEQGKAGPRSETVTIAEHLAKYIVCGHDGVVGNSSHFRHAVFIILLTHSHGFRRLAQEAPPFGKLSKSLVPG